MKAKLLKILYNLVVCVFGGMVAMLAFYNVTGLSVLSFEGVGLVIAGAVVMTLLAMVGCVVAMIAFRIALNVFGDWFIADDSRLFDPLWRLDQWLDSKQFASVVSSVSLVLGMFVAFLVTAYFWPQHVALDGWQPAAIWALVTWGPALVSIAIEKRLFPTSEGTAAKAAC